MTRIHTRQFSLVPSAVAAVVLATAVFAWGVQYKCSLYHKHPEKHPRIAIAKLLSQRERPVLERSSALRSPLPQAVFFALGVLLVGQYRGTRPGYERFVPVVQSSVGAHSRLCLTYFSFRPPPALAF